MSFTEEVKKDAQIVAKDIKGRDNYLTSSIVLAGIATLLVVGVLLYQYVSASNLLKNALNYLRLQEQITAPTPALTPTPIPLPRGPREFGVSGGDNPSITNLKFSEYNPKVGEQQTITVSILDGQGQVLGAEIALTTDHKTKVYPLTLLSGTTKKGDWATTITADDTRNYVYAMTITAKNDKGQTNIVEPRFR
jgi:hypothetical protein